MSRSGFPQVSRQDRGAHDPLDRVEPPGVEVEHLACLKQLRPSQGGEGNLPFESWYRDFTGRLVFGKLLVRCHHEPHDFDKLGLEQRVRLGGCQYRSQRTCRSLQPGWHRERPS